MITDNIIAALRQSNRVCEIDLDVPSWRCWEVPAGRLLGKVLVPMQVPFPELTALRFKSDIPIPDSFLGGSAPRLQHCQLIGIPLPELPKWLLSATHLVSLKLSHFGYISPEAVVALISVLSSLRTFTLQFNYHQFYPGWESRSLPPPKRSILPALHNFIFEGVIEYLEDLVTRIDTPQLDILNVTFFNRINFDCPQLTQFINCTPKIRALDEVHVQFPYVILRYRTFRTGFCNLLICITSSEPNRQLSSIGQVCNSSLHLLSTVEDLHFKQSLRWNKDAIENALWLQFLLPYTAVKNLYLSKEFVPSIGAALQELVGARITEVLPRLQNIFVEVPEPLGPFQDVFGQFVTARQLSGHPVAILSGTEITNCS